MGCIYLLEDCNGNGYIGKTKNLKQRLIEHKRKTNKCSSRLLNNFECLVIEEFDDEDDLDNAEQFYYDLYKGLYGDKIVNRCRPLQTQKEQTKRWRETHKEHMKEYRQTHKERIAEEKKEWYEKNKDKLAERKKEYYKINKNKIAERIKQKITCECGSVINYGEKTPHSKSKKHQNYLSNNN